MVSKVIRQVPKIALIGEGKSDAGGNRGICIHGNVSAEKLDDNLLFSKMSKQGIFRFCAKGKAGLWALVPISLR